MMDVSPIAYVEDVETPTAFFLGGKDKRCPLSQGLEYHKALYRLGVSTEAYVFPNCNHTLQNVADEGVDAMVLMISWLKRHID
jgi:dipeptidyl aminopeptidase/acylaminoacyl peptidase